MSTVDFSGETAYVLGDGTGSRAWIVPAVGSNCIAFQTPVAGRMVHVLSTPASAEALRARPTFWGFPILSPYPGRHQTPFHWLDKEFHILSNDRPGVALHGIAAGARWEVLEASEGRLTCRFDSETVPGRGQRWPWPYLLTATYSLQGGALRLDLEVENRADVDIPQLLGLHPYFPVRFTPSRPLSADALPTAAELAGDGGAGWRNSCLVWVEADHLWEMKAGLGTGTIRPLEGGWDLRTPQAVGEAGGAPGATPGPGAVRRRRHGTGATAPGAAVREARGAGSRVGRPAVGGAGRGHQRDQRSGVQGAGDPGVEPGLWLPGLVLPPGAAFHLARARSAVSDALTLMHGSREVPTGVCRLAPGGRWRAWVRLSAATLDGGLPPSGRA